jgi:hypothetical protein
MDTMLKFHMGNFHLGNQFMIIGWTMVAIL